MRTSLKLALITIVPALSVLALLRPAKGQVKPVECYRFQGMGSPAAEENGGPSLETWCYKDLEEPEGARLIYNVDAKGRTRPELTLMVEADGVIRHASLLKGKLTVHRVRFDAAGTQDGFNPLGVPLTPPAGAKQVAEPIAPTAADSVDKQIEMFQEWGDIGVKVAKVVEGDFDISVPASSMPWHGYWYPYSSARMYTTDDSPLAKYDKFIARRAGNTNPGAQAWERRRHSGGLQWSGHCNGWAAASTMTKEPLKPITDPFSGAIFSVNDQKALLIERNYCPKLAFFGARFYGKPGDDPRDIYARTFHNVITYVIGELKKPVLMDLMASRPVENSVLSGFHMKVRKAGTHRFSVEIQAKVHNYDSKLIDPPGEAPSKIRTYRYTLTTDDNDMVVNGSWSSSNPDFLWVPIAPADCEFRNPVVEQFWIDEIAKFAN